MKNKTQGFTLIELLIVIAIIGILAAVLIPNLLGARTTANKRAVQAHSSNVYKAVTAVYADDATIDPTALATAAQTECVKVTPTSTLAVGDKTFQYGWQASPAAARSSATATNCTIAFSSATNDFTVTITGNATAGSVASVNGN